MSKAWRSARGIARLSGPWRRRRRRTELGVRLFFVHIMRTGGTSFRHMLWDAMESDQIYPNREDLAANGDAYVEMAEFARLPAETFHGIDVVTGHLPFVAQESLPGDPAVVTLLRDPVDRSLSHLFRARVRKPAFRNMSLLDLLDIPAMREGMIRNYQTKYFALDSLHCASSVNDPIDIDASHLEVALERLEGCSVVGVTDRFPQFLDAIQNRFGFTFPRVLRKEVRDRECVEPRVIEVLHELTAADRVLYERATTLSARARP